MALIDALLDKISDRALRQALREQVNAMLAKQSFGLVFQQHAPETVELHNYKVRRNCKVRIKSEDDGVLYRVESVKGDTATVQSFVEVPERWDVSVHDLVVIREFGDPIYPGLRCTGTVSRGGDKPPHLVINGENFHALETLLYTHEGKVDCIYIDPPYNTRDRDWKYNNDYVDSDDVYRHSKWLAMMDRRLRLAKRLLKSDDSVLICTIDEKEIHRLALLVEQTFPAARMQMVTITINHRGVARKAEFTRVEEYALFVFIGEAGPVPTSDDLLSPLLETNVEDEQVRWERLIKGSNNARRVDRPNLFYPVWVDPARNAIAKVGEPLPLVTPRESVEGEPGLVAVWPLGSDGSEKRWQCAPATLRTLIADGMARVGRYDATNDRYSIAYLNRGQRQRIERGDVTILGRDGNGVLQLQQSQRTLKAGMTVWNRNSHNAGYHGSGIISSLIPGRKFPFPKSLYAVEDALRFAVGNKPDAVVLDFFGGSGTTGHAVLRLNRQDEGRRRSIIVTNNEVSEEEQEALREAGLQPGDEEWERLGICEYVTKPRLQAAVTGVTPDGAVVRDQYKFRDEFPMGEGFEENLEFFDLTYEDPNLISVGRKFEAVAPLLWLKAGGVGARLDKPTTTWTLPDDANYGILFDTDEWRGFVDAVIARAQPVAHAYIVTDSEAAFQQILTEMPSSVEATQLYTDYIRTFEINTKGRA